MFKYISAMSRDRQFVIDRSKAFTDNIEFNLLKCAIYQNSTQDYNHWIERIASWLYSVSKARLNGNKKLKAADYRKNTFSFIGDSLDDAESDIVGFLATNEDNIERGAKSYPSVTYDPKAAERLLQAWDAIAVSLPSILAQNKIYSTPELESLLHEALDTILLQK